MATWIVAESLDRLLAQLNAYAPHRSKASDGSIGDAAHQAAGTSDHLARQIAGALLVSARDYTNDPAGGLDCQRLADALQRAKDSRIKYVIWNRRIMSGAAGPSPWVWRAYHGANPHTHHLHLSVVADARCRDGGVWMLPGLTSSVTPKPSGWPTIQLGDSGTAVGVIQRFLGVHPVDEQFGNVTEAAVKRYQTMRGLTADGIVGAATWAATGL